MKVTVIAMIFFFAACKTSQPADICDSDFNTFFEKFAADSVFQKKHVDFPVTKYYSDEDFPLDVMETMIDSADYVFTDFTNDKKHYDVSVETKKDSVIYTQRMRDRYQLPIIYKFLHKDNCWKLVELQDLTD